MDFLKFWKGITFKKEASTIVYAANNEGSLYNNNNTEIRTQIQGADRVVVTGDQAQKLTNKDYTGGVATNTRRLLLPTESTVALDALTDIAGLFAYDSTKSLPVYNDGTGWFSIAKLKLNLTAVAAPTVTDDSASGYEIGSLWYFENVLYFAVSVGVGTAVWRTVNDVIVRSITNTYTALPNDNIILADLTAGAFTLTLPAAATSKGRILYIRKTDATANLLTIDGNASETINGNADRVLYNQNEDVTIFCNGTAWFSMNDKQALATSTRNIGINYSGATGVFKITSMSGLPLSTSNYGEIVFQSSTSGLKKIIRVTSDVSFIDDVGASDIIGEEFGTVAGTARTVAKAFYIYSTIDASNNVAFFISPRPNMTVVPTLASVGWKGNPSPTPSDDSSWFLLSSSPSAAYTGFPCTRIGGFRMLKSAADDWTVQTLTVASGDGITDQPFLGTELEYPVGVEEDVTLDPAATQGFGTPTFVYAKCTRRGKKIRLDVQMSTGTPTAAEARIPLPKGLKIASTNRGGIFGVNSGISASPGFVLAIAGNAYVNFASFSSGMTVAANGNAIVSIAGHFVIFSTEIETTEWS